MNENLFIDSTDLPPIIIGLSGVARSGKDTLCKFLIEEFAKKNLRAKKYALAEELKNEMADFIFDKFKINVNDCEGEEKKIIRPLLVAYGYAFRELSKGKHWTSITEKKICQDKNVDVAIITDIRYDEFPEDELWWLKKKLNGFLVHVSRYETSAVTNERKEIKAPNEEELVNDPKIKRQSDILINWDTFASQDSKLYIPYAKQVIQKIPAFKIINHLKKIIK